MKRLFLAALFVVLLSLTIPSLRERAMPRYRALGAWTWGWLEGPMTPVLTPWRRLNAQSEMAQIGSQLIIYRNRGQPPPDTDELPDFLRRVALDTTATDIWGTPYIIRATQDSVYLISSGQDTTLETEDDLVVALRYPSPYRRPGRRIRR